MSNGARHTWGFFAGVVLTAALAGLLIFGTYRLQHGFMMQFHKQDKWIGGGMLAGAAVVFALLAASRLSPLAGLIGGLVLTAVGALFFVSQKATSDLISRFPFKAQRVTLAGLEEEGFILFAGVGLLLASFFPSRWRSRHRDPDDGYEYGLPDDTYGRPADSATAARPADSATGGRHAARDERPTASAYGAATQRTDYDVPLYEPPRQQSYGGRSPFARPEEDGGTREMGRP